MFSFILYDFFVLNFSFYKQGQCVIIKLSYIYSIYPKKNELKPTSIFHNIYFWISVVLLYVFLRLFYITHTSCTHWFGFIFSGKTQGDSFSAVAKIHSAIANYFQSVVNTEANQYALSLWSFKGWWIPNLLCWWTWSPTRGGPWGGWGGRGAAGRGGGRHRQGLSGFWHKRGMLRVFVTLHWLHLFQNLLIDKWT